MTYIDNDTINYKTDLKYSNDQGDTLVYLFQSMTKSLGDSCMNSPINSCECESVLNIEYYCQKTSKKIEYTFYNTEKYGFGGGSIQHDGRIFIYEYNFKKGITYDSLLTIIDSTDIDYNRPILFVSEGHLNKFIDSQKIMWERIK